MNKDSTTDLDTITISAGQDMSSVNLGDLDLTIPALDTIDISTLNSGFTGSTFSGPYTINTIGNSSLNYNYTTNWAPMISSAQGSNQLDVKGDANFEGDIKWKGRSIGDMLEKIESRLAILTPDPKKLEHFEALKKAYENYKTLERLCQLEEKDDEQQ